MARGEWRVQVEWERVQGKFAPREDITEAIQEAIEEAISGLGLTGLGIDNNSEYEVTDSSVEELDTPKRRR